MLFIPLLIISIFLYLNGKRISSVIIFFFFLTDGFQVIPLEWFDTKLGINKPLDFCFLYIIFLCIYGMFRYQNFINTKDKIGRGIFLFLGFVTISVFVNRSLYSVPWTEIIRTSRFYFIILSYFLFLRLEKEEINKIQKILLVIVTAQSTIYLLQIITGEIILTGYTGGWELEGIGIKRFYNTPTLIHYFTFYALFNNPFEGKKKIISIVILTLTFLLPLHRGFIAGFVILCCLGIFLQQEGIKNSFKYILIGFICTSPIIDTIIARFDKTGESEFDNIKTGVFQEYSEELNLMGEGTMTYRFAHLYERYIHVIKNPQYIVFGLGYMSDDSPATEERFNFLIGLRNEDDTGIYQLDTPDIAWSNLLVRFGFVGTIIYLIFFFTLVFYFWKQRKNTHGLTSLLYLLLFLITSISSSQLYYMWLLSVVFLDISILKQTENDI